ncbi:YbfB/YjiJ family MFS transporter [Ramlibacter albus]|uniref:YbfB/YjiJ family MFS transporter n=1 Tax=Ramlibacter albus TaxID=2079448 RepID=A0A923M761_9BURK|nr:YbfB/YjiJ family MFS transporter [Ramlibacter albus]MBC5763964.1 YbfB/YjiJ family MFS transporter [Ramlibacter albus]
MNFTAMAGLLSLAVAMGIGRFAFTPVLPLMLRSGELDVATAGWIAAANYAGYLVGAMTAARVKLRAGALGIAALVATAVLTAAMAAHGPVAWGLLRFAAGVASAWAFVATSVWCLGALAQQGKGHLGGVVYAGVGVGIAITGAYCLVAGAGSAQSLWIQLGALALVLALPAMVGASKADGGVPSAHRDAARPTSDATGLVVSYGLMGFGYILPATFLPVMARSVVDDARVFGLAWPVFGAMAAISTVLAAAWLKRASRLTVWSACQLAMGVGVLLPSLWLTGWTIALSAVLVGGTFMVITLAGVQEMRARAPHDPAAAVGRMTAAFAFGQIAGPVCSSLLLHVPAFAAHGLNIALQLAAAGLLLSGLWLARETSRIPTNPEVAHAR